MGYFLHLDSWSVENNSSGPGVLVFASFRLGTLGERRAALAQESEEIAVRGGTLKIDFQRKNGSGITEKELLEAAQSALREAKLSHS